MTDLGVRSPFVRVGGVVYFGRMIDKIRENAKGALPSDYQGNLGKGFDEVCCRFLRVDYTQLVDRVNQGGSDDELLEWCFARGRRPEQEEIYIWNEFMRKRGWNDELSETLKRRKKESGMAGRSEIQTMFEYIDADDGRTLVAPARPEAPLA